MRNRILSLGLGTVFGFFLARSGAFEFAHVRGMFELRDFHLFGILGVAVPLAGLGIYLMQAMGIKSPEGVPIKIDQRKRHPGNLPGGVIFGMGWALSGICPGTSLAQAGSYAGLGIMSILGMALGMLVYRKVHDRYFSWEYDSCG